MNIKDIFDEFAKVFEKKISKDYHIRLQFEIYDMENDIWQIEAKNGKVFVYNEAKIEPEGDTFIISKATLQKLYNNELSSFTAFLENPELIEKGEKIALITGKHRNELGKVSREKNQSDYQNNRDFWDRRVKFQNNFFSKDYPTKINVTDKNSVKHNGDIDTICLYTDGMEGFSQIFVSIKKGEVLKYPATEFNIYIICGKGKMVFGNNECEIKFREYYHMNTKENTQIKNTEEEPLEIIILFHNK
jgi:mannose-6-phosphate isomerase-like protein (cupin superfamily)